MNSDVGPGKNAMSVHRRASASWATGSNWTASIRGGDTGSMGSIGSGDLDGDGKINYAEFTKIMLES